MKNTKIILLSLFVQELMKHFGSSSSVIQRVHRFFIWNDREHYFEQFQKNGFL